jgi:hypothetical protein
MNYSICYQDTKGVTKRSEFLPFDQDYDAVAYAHTALAKNALVEVWKGDALVSRMDGAGASI